MKERTWTQRLLSALLALTLLVGMIPVGALHVHAEGTPIGWEDVTEGTGAPYYKRVTADELAECITNGTPLIIGYGDNGQYVLQANENNQTYSAKEVSWSVYNLESDTRTYYQLTGDCSKWKIQNEAILSGFPYAIFLSGSTYSLSYNQKMVDNNHMGLSITSAADSHVFEEQFGAKLGVTVDGSNVYGNTYYYGAEDYSAAYLFAQVGTAAVDPYYVSLSTDTVTLTVADFANGADPIAAFLSETDIYVDQDSDHSEYTTLKMNGEQFSYQLFKDDEAVSNIDAVGEYKLAVSVTKDGKSYPLDQQITVTVDAPQVTVSAPAEINMLINNTQVITPEVTVKVNGEVVAAETNPAYTWEITNDSSNAGLEEGEAAATVSSETAKGTATVTVDLETLSVNGLTVPVDNVDAQTVTVNIYDKTTVILTVDETPLSLDVQEEPKSTTLDLGYTVIPAGQDVGTIEYSAMSSDASVANVEIAEGKLTITAAGKGTANVTVSMTNTSGGTVDYSDTATIQVTVTDNMSEPYVLELESDSSEDVYDIGETFTLTPVLTQGTATRTDTYTWTSSQPSLASVENGVVKILNPSAITEAETVTVTATGTVMNGETPVSATYEFSVNTPSVNILADSRTFHAGMSAQIAYTLTGVKDTSNYSVEWSSDSPSVASIDENGVVVAHSPGEATVTLALKDVNGLATEGISDTITILVVEGQLFTQDELLDPNKVTVVANPDTNSYVIDAYLENATNDDGKYPYSYFLNCNKHIVYAYENDARIDFTSVVGLRSYTKADGNVVYERLPQNRLTYRNVKTIIDEDGTLGTETVIVNGQEVTRTYQDYVVDVYYYDYYVEDGVRKIEEHPLGQVTLRVLRELPRADYSVMGEIVEQTVTEDGVEKTYEVALAAVGLPNEIAFRANEFDGTKSDSFQFVILYREKGEENFKSIPYPINWGLQKEFITEEGFTLKFSPLYNSDTHYMLNVSAFPIGSTGSHIVSERVTLNIDTVYNVSLPNGTNLQNVNFKLDFEFIVTESLDEQTPVTFIPQYDIFLNKLYEYQGTVFYDHLEMLVSIGGPGDPYGGPITAMAVDWILKHQTDEGEVERTDQNWRLEKEDTYKAGSVNSMVNFVDLVLGRDSVSAILQSVTLRDGTVRIQEPAGGTTFEFLSVYTLDVDDVIYLPVGGTADAVANAYSDGEQIPNEDVAEYTVQWNIESYMNNETLETVNCGTIDTTKATLNETADNHVAQIVGVSEGETQFTTRLTQVVKRIPIDGGGFAETTIDLIESVVDTTRVIVRDPVEAINVVIDYDKPILISSLTSGGYDGYTVKGIVPNGGGRITESFEGLYGTFTFNSDGSVTYDPNKILHGIDTCYCVLEVTVDGVATTVMRKIHVIPATVMYYETDFTEGEFFFSGTTEKCDTCTYGDWVTTKAATCSATGIQTRTCTVCGSKETQEISINAENHTWNEGTVTTASTCTTSGVKTYTCTACNATKTETISAAGHSWGEGSVTKAATCTEAGVTTYTCGTCGETKTEDVAATGHSWSGWTTTKEPTENEAGEQQRECSVCHTTQTQIVAALGCSHNYESNVTAPTCTEQGYTTYSCTKCGGTYNADYVPATGHNYTSEETTAASCTTTGVRTYTCSSCGVSYTESIEATGHNYTSEVTTAASCTTTGVRTYTCSSCGVSYTESIEATGHNYTSEVTTAASCTTTGVRTYTCSGCGNSYTETIDATGHTWGEWTVTKEATEAEAGQETQECTVCHIIQNRTVTLAVTSVLTATGDSLISSGDGRYKTNAEGTTYYDGWIQSTETSNSLYNAYTESDYIKVTFSYTGTLEDEWASLICIQTYVEGWKGYKGVYISVGNSVYDSETGTYTYTVNTQDILDTFIEGEPLGIQIAFVRSEPEITLLSYEFVTKTISEATSGIAIASYSYPLAYADGTTDSTASGEWEMVGDKSQNAEWQDEYVPGSDLYGNDSHYADTYDTGLSDGTSWFVNGTTTMEEIKAGDPSTYVTFTFTGTGFDIISRTNANQGTIRVWVYAATDTAHSNPLRNVSVINKGVGELYQIPVVSVEGLEHGVYDVVIAVYDAVNYGSVLSIGNEFYFDAIRVYGTINTDATTTQAAIAANAYKNDKEYDPEFIELGQHLIENAPDGNDKILGVIYLDDPNGETTDSYQKYDKIGANNEIYLENNNGVAFLITVDEKPDSIHIGAKSILGTTVTMNVTGYIAAPSDGVWKTDGTSQTIQTCTQQYYDMTSTLQSVFDQNGNKWEAYIVIWNSGDSILSITDLKLAYSSDVEAASELAVTQQAYSLGMRTIAQANNYDIVSAAFTAESVKTGDEVQMTVVTTQDVVRLEVTDENGNLVESHSLYVDTATGDRVWTVTLNPIALGEQTFTVTGYNAEGEAGSSVSATIMVTM